MVKKKWKAAWLGVRAVPGWKDARDKAEQHEKDRRLGNEHKQDKRYQVGWMTAIVTVAFTSLPVVDVIAKGASLLVSIDHHTASSRKKPTTYIICRALEYIQPSPTSLSLSRPEQHYKINLSVPLSHRLFFLIRNNPLVQVTVSQTCFFNQIPFINSPKS